MKTLFASLCGAALLWAANPATAEVAVVVGAQSGVGKLTAEQVADLYTGKQTALPGGGAVQLVDLPDSSPVRTQFYESGVGKSVKQVKATWARLLFSGQGVPPVEAADPAGVKKLLAANPNALGYIDRAAVDPSVKVLLLVN